MFLSEFESPLEFAEDLVSKTMLEYSRYNRPEIMRGKKSVLFVFKSFVVGNLELQQRLWNSLVDANETALTSGPPRGGKPPRTPSGPPETGSGTGGGSGDDGPRLPGEPFDAIAPGGPRPKAWWKKTAFARSLFVTALGGGVYVSVDKTEHDPRRQADGGRLSRLLLWQTEIVVSVLTCIRTVGTSFGLGYGPATLLRRSRFCNRITHRQRRKVSFIGSPNRLNKHDRRALSLR